MSSGATAFIYVAVRILVALALGALLGWFAGSVWAGISGTLALYLAWNLWQLRELWYWLQHRSVADPPDAIGHGRGRATQLAEQPREALLVEPLAPMQAHH